MLQQNLQPDADERQSADELRFALEQVAELLS
jgi:hypothetical protein